MVDYHPLVRAQTEFGRFNYVTFDDPTVRAAAAADPTAFLDGHDGPLAIDEIQLVPELLRAIKLRVDRKRTPGRYLLTGSSNVMLVPRLAESLAGRMEILELRPFSQAELERTEVNFIDRMFARTPPPTAPVPSGGTTSTGGTTLTERMIRGGYPEAVTRRDAARRGAWFDSYVATILQRDVREIANIDGLASLPRLLELLAARTSGLLNMAGLASDFILERSDGVIVAIEVRSASAVSASDFRAMEYVQRESSVPFMRGIVLYNGNEIVPFGKHLFAVPLPMLWQ